MEMRNHGLNPEILNDEEAELPDSDLQGGGVSGARAEEDSEIGTSASSSSSDASDDDSFESD